MLLKRGFTTIEIIAIMVVVLVLALVLIIAITNTYRGASQFGSCESGGQNGKCQAVTSPCPPERPATVFTSDCKGTMKCCIPGG